MASPRPAEVLTERLRLVPIGPERAEDFWLVHNDDAVVPGYDGWRPTLAEARERTAHIAECWRGQGVHKWMAYDRASGEVIGRGGLSRTPADDDWGQVHAFLPDAPWVREVHECPTLFASHAGWLELGWALRRAHWGMGYASEIGRAGLDFAFASLGVHAVVSCTAEHNTRSRAVMQRIGLHYAGVIFSPGIPEGGRNVVSDAPFATYVALRR